MSRPGPRPMPTNLKVLHGQQKSRINTKAPVPPEGAPELLPDVTDPEVIRTWELLVEMTGRLGVQSPVDGIALLVFAQAVVIHQRAAALINSSAILVKDRDNSLRKNPAFQPWRDSAQLIRAWCQEFGLTPSARTLLVDPRHLNQDSRERLLSG